MWHSTTDSAGLRASGHSILEIEGVDRMICEKCGRETVVRHYFPGIAKVTHRFRHGLWVCAFCIAESCGITIPQSLVEKLPGRHYIRVAKCSKRPLDEAWPDHPMRPDDPVLQQHLAHGGNYGVVGGNGIVILDADTGKVKQAIKKHLPETFTVQSPGSLGWHCYYQSNLKDPVRLRDVDKDGKKVNIGDIQGGRKMCVGPNSFHPCGQRYEVIKNLPLAWVSAEELREALSQWILFPEERVKKLIRQVWRERQLVDISILDVVPLGGLRKNGDEYWGPHPSHGSSTGHNFWVNPSKDVWHCFRHDTGGGPLLWIAVEEDIIRCEEAVPGALKGEVFREVIEAAERRGFKVPGFLKRKISLRGEAIEFDGRKFRLPVTEYKL